MFAHVHLRRPLLLLLSLVLAVGLVPIATAEHAFACTCQDLYTVGYWQQHEGAIANVPWLRSHMGVDTAEAILGHNASPYSYDQHFLAAELNAAKTPGLLDVPFHGTPIHDLLNAAESALYDSNGRLRAPDTTAPYYQAVLYIGGDGYGNGSCELWTSAPTPTATTVPPTATRTNTPIPPTATRTTPVCPNDTVGMVKSATYYLINDNPTHVFPLQGHVSPGDRVTAYFTIASGCAAMQLSLVSYKAVASTFSLDNVVSQTVFMSDTNTFGPGSHSLMVTVPSCFYQVDFATGGVLDHLGPGNLYSSYGNPPTNHLIDGANGGANTCAVPPTSTNTPTATATRTNTPTATSTNTPTSTTPPTTTGTGTPIAPTSTNTTAPTAANTPVPTDTAANTPVPPTNTATPVNTATSTSAPATGTSVPANTPVPPANTTAPTSGNAIVVATNTPAPTATTGLNVIRDLVVPSPTATATAYAQVLAANAHVVAKPHVITKTRYVTKPRVITKTRYVVKPRYHDVIRVHTVTRTRVAVKTIVRYHDITRVRVVTKVHTVVNHKTVTRTVVRYQDVVRVHTRTVVTHKTVINTVAAYHYVHHPKTGRFAGPLSSLPAVYHGAPPAAEARISLSRLGIVAAPVWSRSFVAGPDGSLRYEIVPAYGVTRFADSAPLGQPGLSLMSGHDDIYGSIFRYLGRMHRGDVVVVTRGAHTYRYVVRSASVVTPDDVRLLNAPYTRPTLALISCTPYWVDTHRVVVIAEMQ